MKKLALAVSLFAFGLGVNAQNAVQDKDGNFVALTTQNAPADTTTGKTFTDSKGIVYDVFKGKRGGLYYWRKSKKTGNLYKVYLKTDQD